MLQTMPAINKIFDVYHPAQNDDLKTRQNISNKCIPFS
jgi:hypothetical protein